MRIIHFSDFHLRADHIDRAESIMNRMLEAMHAIHNERHIDLFVFSGDMVDKAGKDFVEPKLTTSLNKFQEMVIMRLTKELGVSENRFVFVPGNHEVDRNKISPEYDNELKEQLENNEEVDKYILNKSDAEPRIKEFNDFRNGYWKTNLGDAVLMITPFQYGVKWDIDGKKVGINCLNTSWRCYEIESEEYTIKDEHKIVTGKSQITDMRDFFEDCHLRFAVGHHRPEMMNPFETNTLNQLIARNYDAFFCGHTHDTDGEYVSRPQGGCFFFTSPGTLSTNESAERKYRNGFMVIDYEQDSRYVDAQCYYQDENADFVKDQNYGTNGTWHQAIPGSSIIKPMKVSLFCQKKDGEFLVNEFIKDVIAKLKDNNNNTIQLVALSGLGKTRILREAFEDGQNRQNHYYCEFADNAVGLLYDVDEIINSHRGQDGLIVLDNCPNALLEAAINKRDGYASKFRIIGVNNEFYDRRNLAVKDVLQIFMTQEHMRQMVNDFIDQQVPEVNGDSGARNNIKKIADGFPGMAVVLVEEYLKERTIDVHTVDRIVKKMLKFEAGQEHNQEIVLRSLALFQPCPYKDEYREAYRFIRDDEGITPLHGWSPEARRHLFSHTIGRYDNSLLEITQCWLNVRPFPLAVWLVGKWFEDDPDEERMEGIVKRIEALDKPLYTVIRDGLYKRLDYMQDSEAAQDLIQRLTGDANAPFCNEKVVCSDLGSRLFLAMSSVNPGAIASCLLKVLMPKGIDWVMAHVAGDIRRNLVWALEKLCFCKDSYNDGSKVMALLAVAENETWGNNASGQFCQLFHIMLPGTEASLQERIETLRYLKAQGKKYEALTLDCIDRAFDNGHFVRDGEGSQFGIKQKTDYVPKSNREILDYWETCRDMLIAWLDETETVLDKVSKLATDHVMRWAYDGMLARMYPLLTKVADCKGGTWEEMYTALKRVGKARTLVYPSEFQNQLADFIQRIRPTSFCQKLKDARTTIYDKYDLESKEQMEFEQNLFRPLARAFLDESVYLSKAEIKEIVTDKEYYDVWFSLALAEIITDEQLEGLLNTIRSLIAELEGDQFRSSFVSRICFVFREREPLRLFLKRLYYDGYATLYVVLLANSETVNLDSYVEINEMIQNDDLKDDAADQYLQFLSINSKEQLKTIIARFYSDHPSKVLSLMDFITSHRYDKEVLFDKETYSIVKQVVLAYPITEDNSRSNYDYAQFVEDMLKEHHDDGFAAALNRKLIEDLNKGYFHRNFDGIYPELLLNYREVIWDDFEKAFVSDDHFAFLFQIRDDIGSGASFSTGPLFQGDDSKVREMCLKYPDKAPYRVANMIPVFKDENGFSDWFVWMLDNFGNQKEVLDNLHANMGTYLWTGSVVPLLAQKKRCLHTIIDHPRPEVRDWTERCLKEVEEELKREITREEYMRLHYN